MIWIILAWWPAGFLGALVCWYVSPGRNEGDELTWGAIIACSFWAIFGPATVFCAMIWGAMYAGEGGRNRDSPLRKPIFKRDR